MNYRIGGRRVALLEIEHSILRAGGTTPNVQKNIFYLNIDRCIYFYLFDEKGCYVVVGWSFNGAKIQIKRYEISSMIFLKNFKILNQFIFFSFSV